MIEQREIRIPFDVVYEMSLTGKDKEIMALIKGALTLGILSLIESRIDHKTGEVVLLLIGESNWFDFLRLEAFYA